MYGCILDCTLLFTGREPSHPMGQEHKHGEIRVRQWRPDVWSREWEGYAQYMHASRHAQPPIPVDLKAAAADLDNLRKKINRRRDVSWEPGEDSDESDSFCAVPKCQHGGRSSCGNRRAPTMATLTPHKPRGQAFQDHLRPLSATSHQESTSLIAIFRARKAALADYMLKRPVTVVKAVRVPHHRLYPPPPRYPQQSAAALPSCTMGTVGKDVKPGAGRQYHRQQPATCASSSITACMCGACLQRARDLAKAVRSRRLHRRASGYNMASAGNHVDVTDDACTPTTNAYLAHGHSEQTRTLNNSSTALAAHTKQHCTTHSSNSCSSDEECEGARGAEQTSEGQKAQAMRAAQAARTY
jgi:hypothetical protein